MKADLRIAVKDYRRSKNGQIPLGSGQLFYHLGKASGGVGGSNFYLF
jgi:hypothetical protein